MKKTIRSKIGLITITLFLFSTFVGLAFSNNMNGKMTFKKIYTEESKAVIDKITAYLIQNDMNKIMSYFPEDSENIENGLSQIEEYLNDNPILEVQLVNVQKNNFTSLNGKTTNEVYQFQTIHKENFGILSIQTSKSNGSVEVRNLNLNPMKDDLIKTNSFIKEKMGLQRISLIIMGLLLNTFVLFTIYHYYIKCDNPKLLRIVLLSISIIFVCYNWNTMDKTYNLMSISLNPFSIFRSGNVGVWQFKLYTPIFSILYWIKWKDKFINSERIIKKKVKKKKIKETV